MKATITFSHNTKNIYARILDNVERSLQPSHQRIPFSHDPISSSSPFKRIFRQKIKVATLWVKTLSTIFVYFYDFFLSQSPMKNLEPDSAILIFEINRRIQLVRIPSIKRIKFKQELYENGVRVSFSLLQKKAFFKWELRCCVPFKKLTDAFRVFLPSFFKSDKSSFHSFLSFLFRPVFLFLLPLSLLPSSRYIARIAKVCMCEG